MSDYYEQMKNELIIGEIRNAFVYAVTNYKGGISKTEYFPYNFIFTQNFFLGDRLNSKVITSVPGSSTEQNFKNLKGYLSSASITNSPVSVSAEKFTKIDTKTEYNKVKKVTLNNTSSAEDPFYTDYEPLELGRMTFEYSGFLSLGATTIFIFSGTIYSQVLGLLKKTSLAAKLVQI